MEQFCFHFGLDRVMLSRQEKYTKVNITLKKKKKGKIKQKKKPVYENRVSHPKVTHHSRETITSCQRQNAAAAAKSLQSCPTLCDPTDGNPPGSAVPGILQARVLEWVAISFSNAGKWKVKVKSLSRVRLLATPWTAAYQAPPSMGFSRQEYWSGVPLPSPENEHRPYQKCSTFHKFSTF